MPTKRIQTLRNGTDALCVFLVSATLQGVAFVLFLLSPQRKTVSPLSVGIYVVLCVGILAAVFWSGMIRVYITSVQLGIKQRVLAALCGWIPGLNLWYLTKIIRICNAEVE
ncbi:MAG: triacylglycerol lipase, partial [Oscillibacter sp.]